MQGPKIEFSLCVLNNSRTKMLQRLELPSPAPTYPVGHVLAIDDDTYIVSSVSTSITTNDSKTFVCYVTEVTVEET